MRRSIFVDIYLLIPYLLAAVISLSMLFSISPDRLLVQAIFFVVGFAIFVYLSRQDTAFYEAVAPYSYYLAVFLLIATYIFGGVVRGSARWIPIGSFQLQTSELAKPLLVLAFSQFLINNPPKGIKNLLKLLLYFAVPFILIFRQPDLGTSLVLTSIILGQVFFAGISWLIVTLGGVAGTVLIKYLPNLLHDYQLKRLESFLDPSGDPLGSGYNVIQSLIAVGSGGLFGKGLGHGTQSHLKFLPERHTDFMFASLGEELGLIGTIVTVVILSVLLFRLLSLAISGKTNFSRLVAIGIFSYLAFQTFINIGMNIGIAPVTGVTLPLISYGGSSILGISISLGIAAAISRGRENDPLIEIK